MVKHTQTIRRQVIDEMFKCFDHFVKLAIKGLSHNTLYVYEYNSLKKIKNNNCKNFIYTARDLCMVVVMSLDFFVFKYGLAFSFHFLRIWNLFLHSG